MVLAVPLALQLVALVLEMPLTENTSNSCKNFLVVPQPMEKPHDASSLALLEDSIKVLAKMSSLGNVAQQALLLHGRSVETIVDSIHVILLHLVVLPLGLEIVVEAIIVVATHMVAMVLRMVVLTPRLDLLAAMLLLGRNNLLRTPLQLQAQVLQAMVAMLLLATTVVIQLNKPWALRQVLPLLLDSVVLVSVLSSSNSLDLLHPHHQLQAFLLHHQEVPLPLLLPAINHHHLLLETRLLLLSDRLGLTKVLLT
jgi:hypothetical protein